MTKIKNVSLEFNCVEKLDSKSYCEKCSHTVIDFTSKTDRDLKEELKKAKGQLVCGLFKKSQLSGQFLKYAAATFIATSSLTIPALGQETIKSDSLLKTCEKIETENEEDVFLGIFIEIQAEPIGGYKKFFQTVASKVTYPAGLTESGKSFVQFAIDTLGQMKDVKLIKGFNELADKEAVRVLTALNYPFKPGKMGGKLFPTRLVIPITFDSKKSGKR